MCQDTPVRVAAVGIEVSFGDRRVLTGVGHTFHGGRLTAVTGPSGSGKSTLLAVLAGLLAPQRGQVQISVGASAQVQVAWILQSTPVLPRRTGLDNVAVGPLSRGLTHSQARAVAARAMDRLGILGLAPAPAYRLSGGERQRIVVARAMATSAHLVLADEPTASLDAHNRTLVCDALAAAARSGCAVVVATHDNAVAGRCDETLQLSPAGAETP